MSAPAVSVIMPVHNAAAYVREAVRSVLEQTFRDLELIAVDDASTDGSGESLRAIGDTRVRVLRSDHPLNAAGARNLALAEAHGEFIAFLDADDIAEPHRLNAQISLLRSRPEISIVASIVTTIDERGTVSGTNFVARPSHEVPPTLLFENCLALSSVTARRSALKPFRPERAPAEDYDLWMRLGPSAGFEIQPQPLTRYRVNSAGVSARQPEKMREAVAAVHAEMLERLGFRETAPIHSQLAIWPIDATESQLAQAEAWLLALVAANDRRSLYPPALFRRIVAVRWFRICLDSWLLGWTVWQTYHRSALSRPTLWQKALLLRRLLPQRLRGS
jgi:glycosyltransferase involved in cell wall biosynthesis